MNFTRLAFLCWLTAALLLFSGSAVAVWPGLLCGAAGFILLAVATVRFLCCRPAPTENRP